MSQNALIPIKRRARQSAPDVASTDVIASVSGPRVYVETYGCQMNVADSKLLGSLLGEQGYRETKEATKADVIILNTCAVREKAEERVYRRAEELTSHKRRRPDVVLAIVGCMAEHLKERILERVPDIDVIAGPDAYRRVPGLIDEVRAADGAGVQIDTKLNKAETYEGVAPMDDEDGVSTFLTIQRGCDKFCTFCVVPYTRGRERGVAPREILRLARQSAEQGYKEITLLGQTVNSYRYEDVGFADLLRAVATVDGIERIRFTSPYPVSFTPDVISAMASIDKICPFVHLPVQSGSDAVLERMRRGYTVQEFLDLVAELRKAMPNIGLSTDILSGFCGETEECHQATLSLMREVRFDSAFMFSYSERDLTVAAKKLPDDVPPEVKKQRLQEIIELQSQISKEKYGAKVGTTQRVLLHSVSKRSPDQLVGRTEDFKSVIVPKGDACVGSFADVRIGRATMATLFADGL